MSYVLILLMTIDVVVVVFLGASIPPFISKGDEVTRKVTESVIT
jgi:hypothetical protein